MLRIEREHWEEKARRAIRVAERGREEREAKRREARKAVVGLRKACKLLTEREEG